MTRRVPGRLIVGLMSGTSHDGVDAALVRIRGSGGRARVRFLHHVFVPYPQPVRRAVRSALDGHVSEVCRINVLLGEVFSRAVEACVRGAGLRLGEVSAVASHGQTLFHVPPSGRKGGCTLQVGEAAVMAARTGLAVVSDFRPADMAHGGQGAPLVPFADHVLFRDRAPCAVHNLGGISNLTAVTPDVEGVFGFDTGPGNALLDEAMLALTGRPLDRDGRLARKGRAHDGLLRELMRHPFLRRRPPKSTGRELFGPAMARELLARWNLSAEDAMATLTRFTALSVRDAYRRFVLPTASPREVILTGGGTMNGFLVELLRDALAPLTVRLIDELGIPARAKEAVSFAVLANETLSRRPSGVPRATGAHRPAVLGKISYP
jgi:anhydro-N-acetylmuramic acid kinase